MIVTILAVRPRESLIPLRDPKAIRISIGVALLSNEEAIFVYNLFVVGY